MPVARIKAIEDALSVGKASGTAKLGQVLDDDGHKPQGTQQRGQGLRNVATPAQKDEGGRVHGLHEDLHFAAAAHA